jgi:hypothetical protein
MRTREDNTAAMLEGWWIGRNGLYTYDMYFSDPQSTIDYLLMRAKENSDMHIRAFNHMAFCKLTGTDPCPERVVFIGDEHYDVDPSR